MAKTLLRYPGGKSRAIKKIVEYFPKDLKEICSPFFGGGSIELYMESNGVKVYGYDSFELLVNFWKHTLHPKSKNNDFVFRVLSMFQEGITKEDFKMWQNYLSDYKENDSHSASLFYMLNRCSFSGTTLSGGMSPNTPRFNRASVERLIEFKTKNLSIECEDFETSINRHKETFKYCDPPYIIDSYLYGVKGNKHKEFDHERLAKVLKSNNNWILSYNDCEWVREMYKEYEIKELSFSYGMSKSKTELLILNI